MPSLAAVVPATNRPPTLERCVKAIKDAVEPPEELLVIEGPPYAGPAQARNAGALQANGEVLVFIDADVIVHRDVFARIRRAFDSTPQLTALFGNYDGCGSGGLLAEFRNLLFHDAHKTASGPATTFWAGLGAVRRDTFFAVGGFDAARFPRPTVEDIDLGMRLAAAGGHIELEGTLFGTHLKQWTLLQALRTDLFDRGVPWITLLLRHGQTSTALNLGWRYRVSAAASVMFVGSLLRKRWLFAAAWLTALLILNRSLYSLLYGRYGLVGAVGGVGLHTVHYLTNVAAVPLGVLVYVRERGR
jgi:glycosyltransferase involved in cell wall biosynthesis